MGDVADMMLDGTLCEGCGEYLGSDNGYPTYCGDCAKENKKQEKEQTKKSNIERNARQEKTKCAVCGKKVKLVGIDQHVLDVHGKPEI